MYQKKGSKLTIKFEYEVGRLWWVWCWKSALCLPVQSCSLLLIDHVQGQQMRMNKLVIVSLSSPWTLLIWSVVSISSCFSTVNNINYRDSLWNITQSTCGLTRSYALYILLANVQQHNAPIVWECLFHKLRGRRVRRGFLSDPQG